MKFALFEFCEDNSCAIGESKWIVGQDESSFNNNDWMQNKEVLVRWPTTKDYSKWSNKNGKLCPVVPECETKTFAARVLKFNDQYDGIHGMMTTYLSTGSTQTPIRGRGKRTSKRNERYLENIDDDETPPSKKVKTKTPSNSVISASHIQHLKDKIAEEKNKYSGSSDESESGSAGESEYMHASYTEIVDLRKQLYAKDGEIKLLKEEIRNQNDVQKLQDVVLELKASVRSLTKLTQGASTGIQQLESRPFKKYEVTPLRKLESTPVPRCPSSPICETVNESSSASSSDCDTHVDNLTLCPGITISKGQKKILSGKLSPKEFIYCLMPMLWSREVLCSHSVSGRKSNAHKNRDAKPQLDNEKVESICSYASQKFGCPVKDIRQHMAGKINNIIKCCRVQK